MTEQPPHPELAPELQRLRARVAELEAAAARQAMAADVLRESEQLYRSLVETSPDCIAVTDLEGRILMANHQTAVTYGYATAAEMVGMNSETLLAPEYVEQGRLDIQGILERNVRDHQHPLRRKDGTTFVGEFSGSLIRDEQGKPKYILYNGRDITARIRLQRELIESQKLESIGRLAGGVAHDFNNMLAVILGNASLQLRNKTLPHKTLECLADIVEAAERATTLTNQLLAYARGGLRRPAPADINKVVRAAWELLRRTAPRQTEIHMELAADLPPITIDQGQIQQVIVNLCLNAIQATPLPGKIEVSTVLEEIPPARAEELELRPGHYIVLRVRDVGCGMDPSTVERAFEPFFSTKPDSRGMGLPAALGIVQSHAGRLLLRSAVNEGTQAMVYLPVDTAPSEKPVRPESLCNPPCGHETILVLDDDPDVSHTAEQILASVGYCVVTRNDADAAVAFLQTNAEDVDLVIMNLNLPKYTASQALQLLQDNWPLMPILLTSGNDRNESLAPLLKAGAAGFLKKPFSLLSMALAVRKVLDAPAKRSQSS